MVCCLLNFICTLGDKLFEDWYWCYPLEGITIFEAPMGLLRVNLKSLLVNEAVTLAF